MITQTNITNVDNCLMKNCYEGNSSRDFSKYLGHDGDWSYLFDVCNKKGKVICLAFFATEIVETLENNGFEVYTELTNLPSPNSNHVYFFFREAKTEELNPEIKTFIEENNIEILKQETNYLELRPTAYLLTDKITQLMYKHYYERTKREYDDKITTLGFTKITDPVERLFCKIDNEAIENFKSEINYVDIEDYDNNILKLCYSTNGGYERDVNAYYGGEEYVEDFVNTIKEYPEIKTVEYDLDEEDLTGTLTIECQV